MTINGTVPGQPEGITPEAKIRFNAALETATKLLEDDITKLIPERYKEVYGQEPTPRDEMLTLYVLGFAAHKGIEKTNPDLHQMLTTVVSRYWEEQGKDNPEIDQAPTS